MANVLKMATVNSITTLVEAGCSDRHIAAVLGVDRGTVAKYRKQIQNPPKAPPGTTSDPPPQATGDPPPADSGDLPKPRTGPESLCEPHRELILSKLDQGLCAKRIWQDLVDDQNFQGRYHSVRRFVRRLSEKSPELVRPMEFAPGEEAQIDFGTAAVVKQPDGKTRRPWGVASRAQPLAEGLQRSRLSADDGELHSRSGERLPLLRRRPEDARHRQPQSGREEG